MRIRLQYFLLYFLYNLVVFLVLRLLFLIYFAKDSFQYLTDWPAIFFHGFRLDLSATGYLMLLPVLLLLVSVFRPGRWFALTLKFYTWSLIGFLALITVADLALYKEWGFRMDATPLLYITQPGEAMASVSMGKIISLLSLALLVFAVLAYLYKYYLYPVSLKIGSRAPVWHLLPGLFILGSLFLPIRGGLGTSPINVGAAYFSSTDFLNHAAINLPWNILYSATNFETATNPYVFMSEELAQKNSERIMGGQSTDNQQFLESERPNIIMILLESFSAGATGHLGAEPNITPHLDTLAKSGIVFTNCYSSGDRTDKGFISIFSGYPAQPTTSVIKFPNKTQTLPGLPGTLRQYGYSTRFYYGGDINFANYRSYFLNSGFQDLISQIDFPRSKRICSWGVPDEYLFSRIANDIEQMDEPFFLGCITLNSHPPYDIPAKHAFPGNDDPSLYLSSVHYTDSVIGHFIRTLAEKSLLKNTLIILVSDHGSRLPLNTSYASKNSFHIPMIWYGGALSGQQTIIRRIVSQKDVAATLLTQMNIPTGEYVFSRNIFSDAYPNVITYAYNNGFGYVSDSIKYTYNRVPDAARFESNAIDSVALQAGKAYYQLLYEDLIAR